MSSSKGQCRRLHMCMGVAAFALAVTFVAPLVAQVDPAAAGPTKKDPLRFTAFNVSMTSGMAGVTDIVIERWTTDAERNALLDLVAGASMKVGGQTKLLNALQDIKPRTGYFRTPNSMGWDLKYCRENMLPDGTRQIVIATDKPVSMGAAVRGARVMDYPFTFIEMRMKPNEKGEGKMLVATAIAVKDGWLQLENYGQEPVQLTSITEQVKKSK